MAWKGRARAATWAYGWTAVGANFLYGVKKGREGQPFTFQDLFQPPEAVGKLLGRREHTRRQLLEARSATEGELQTIRQRNAAPRLSTNYPHPPVISQEAETRIGNGVRQLWEES